MLEVGWTHEAAQTSFTGHVVVLGSGQVLGFAVAPGQSSAKVGQLGRGRLAATAHCN